MIGIIAAMSVELEKIVERMEVKEKKTVSGLTFTVGMLEGHETVATVCGEGKVNAAVCAQTMILLFGATRIINTGVAGSLSPTLHVPDVAIATETVQHDYDISPLGFARGQVLCGRRNDEFPDGDAITVRFPADPAIAKALTEAATAEGCHAETGCIVSGDQFIADPAVKEDLVKTFGGIACEMEGGAIAQVCRVAGVPYGVLRAISDNADENAPESFDPQRAAAISIAVTRRALALLA
jgi:adenosylhomocysteine nucleosidase